MIWTSLLGIITLIGLAWALGFRSRSRLINAETAATQAATIPGFVPIEAAVSDDTSAALVAAADGRIALVRPFGDRFVIRLVKDAQSHLEGHTLHLRLPEPGFPASALALGSEAPRWAARL